jgi:hypothetical protein
MTQQNSNNSKKAKHNADNSQTFKENNMTDLENKVLEAMANARKDKDMCNEDLEKKNVENVEVMSVRSIEEALQKNAPKHRKKISKILMKVLESRIKNVNSEYLYPRFMYMESWQRDVIEKIAEKFKDGRKFLPLITNINGEVLVGNTFFHAAEMLGLEYIPAIRITALAEESFDIYWQMLVQFSTELRGEQWEFLRMQLEEFKRIGQ